jgi:hypothetical protein
MRVFNRLLAVFVAAIWCAGLGGLIWAAWQVGDYKIIDTTRLNLAFTNNLTRSDQVSVTIVLGALIALGVVLILMEATAGRRSSVKGQVVDGDNRYQRLESRLARLESSAGLPPHVAESPTTSQMPTAPMSTASPTSTVLPARPRRRALFDRWRHGSSGTPKTA